MNTEAKIYAIGAQFPSAAAVYHAAEVIRDKGFKRWDVHTPFPVHGMDDAMGLGSSRVSLFSLIGGFTGFTTAFFLIYYTSGINYPLIVQGKPYFALEPSFPIFFELTILFTAFFTVISMLVLNFLPRLNHPIFNWDLFIQRSGDDGFFIVIESEDPQFDEQQTAAFLRELGGEHISLIHHES